MKVGMLMQTWPAAAAVASGAAVFAVVRIVVPVGGHAVPPGESLRSEPGAPVIAWPTLPSPPQAHEQPEAPVRPERAAGTVQAPAPGPASLVGRPAYRPQPSPPMPEPQQPPAPAPAPPASPTPAPTPAAPPASQPEPARIVSASAATRWPGRDKHGKDLPPGQLQRPAPAEPQAAAAAYAEPPPDTQHPEHPHGGPPAQADEPPGQAKKP